VIDFIVLGLPRSGTTWLANWLTTDKSLCLHDPFAKSLPETWDAGSKRLGISCTGAYLMPGWLCLQDCPVALIERNPEDCDASLHRMGLGTTWPLRTAFKRADGRRWRFDDLWDEDKARELWAFLLPGLPFDTARYRLLKDMHIEPREVTQDAHITRELIARGWLGG
jgi:hypothetical protein